MEIPTRGQTTETGLRSTYFFMSTRKKDRKNHKKIKVDESRRHVKKPKRTSVTLERNNKRTGHIRSIRERVVSEQEKRKNLGDAILMPRRIIVEK